MKIIFLMDEVKTLLNHAKNSKEHSRIHGPKKTEPGLFLIGDEGVYLASSGEPRLRDAEGEEVVAYAFGMNPEDYDWEEEKEKVFGNDGADFISVKTAEYGICNNRYFVLNVDSSGLLVERHEIKEKKNG